MQPHGGIAKIPNQARSNGLVRVPRNLADALLGLWQLGRNRLVATRLLQSTLVAVGGEC